MLRDWWYNRKGKDSVRNSTFYFLPRFIFSRGIVIFPVAPPSAAEQLVIANVIYYTFLCYLLPFFYFILRHLCQIFSKMHLFYVTLRIIIRKTLFYTNRQKISRCHASKRRYPHLVPSICVSTLDEKSMKNISVLLDISYLWGYILFFHRVDRRHCYTLGTFHGCHARPRR